jgi:hypothetical protein
MSVDYLAAHKRQLGKDLLECAERLSREFNDRRRRRRRAAIVVGAVLATTGTAMAVGLAPIPAGLRSTLELQNKYTTGAAPVIAGMQEVVSLDASDAVYLTQTDRYGGICVYIVTVSTPDGSGGCAYNPGGSPKAKQRHSGAGIFGPIGQPDGSVIIAGVQQLPGTAQLVLTSGKLHYSLPVQSNGAFMSRMTDTSICRTSAPLRYRFLDAAGRQIKPRGWASGRLHSCNLYDPLTHTPFNGN